MKRIIDLQNVADSMPDAFTDIVKVTRSHIPAANVPARLEVPNKGHGAANRGTATALSGGVVEGVAPQGRGGGHLVRLTLTQGRRG